MVAPQWDPDQYARYGAERLRAGFELMARIGALPAGDVVDMGCGAGEHAQALAERFAPRRVIGVDQSEDMLARARVQAAGADFVRGDLRVWAPDAALALVFSNAALHWVDDHPNRLARWLGFLAPGGWLAVQMPSNADSPVHRAIRAICREEGWPAAADGLFDPAWTLSAATYYDHLRKAGAMDVDVWETVYQHALAPEGVIDWLAGTALRPVLAALGEPERARFLSRLQVAVAVHYPERPDGKRLYPQKRVFMVARKP